MFTLKGSNYVNFRDALSWIMHSANFYYGSPVKFFYSYTMLPLFINAISIDKDNFF